MLTLALLLAPAPLPTRPPLPTGPQLIFANGDRVPGQVLGGDENTLLFRPELGSPVEPWVIPIPQIKFLWFTDPPPETPADPDRHPALPNRRKLDYLLLRTGDSRPGTAQRFTASGVEFTPGGTVPFAAIDAFAPNPNLVAPRRLKGDPVNLIFSGGARLTVSGFMLNGERVSAVTGFGAKIDLPSSNVVAADSLVGVKYLSELEPSVEYRSYLSVVPVWARDATPGGKSISLRTPNGTETFERGLGMTPYTKLAFSVPPKAKLFSALVGRDPAELGRGGATVRVLADGADVTPEPARNPAAVAGAVSVRVSGVKKVILEVGFGAAGELPAAVLWADAKFRE